MVIPETGSKVKTIDFLLVMFVVFFSNRGYAGKIPAIRLVAFIHLYVSFRQGFLSVAHYPLTHPGNSNTLKHIFMPQQDRK